MKQATGTFKSKSWDEKPTGEVDGAPKLTRASVANIFQGDIEGESSLEYLMVYPDDQHASFIGLERVTGRLGGREGSFVLQHSGVFDSGKVRATWFVVPGSGSGDLQRLRGEGDYVWDGQHGDAARFSLAYELE